MRQGKTRTTWGYARLSVDLGQLGIESQRREILKFCEAKGWELPDERLITETVPAYKRGKTPVRAGFLRLLEEAEREPEKFRLVTYNLDRLVRDLQDWLRLRTVADLGAEIHAVSGNLDLSTGAGRMQAGVVTSVKEFEVEELTRRIRAQKQTAKIQGKFLGQGRRSFGYSDKTAHRKIVPKEAEVLKESLRRASEEGESWQRLAQELTRKGFKTPNGAAWTAHNLVKTLESAPLYGKMQFFDEDGSVREVQAPWEAILNDEDRETMRQLRQERRTYKGAIEVQNPCSGLLQCGKCDTKKRMASNGPKKYLCGTCGNAINKTHTNNLVEKLCLLRLRDWQPTDEEQTLLSIEQEERELSKLEELLNQGIISRGMWTVGAREIQERIDAKNRRNHARKKKEVPPWMKNGETLLMTWQELTPRQKRDVYLSVFQSVTVLPYSLEGQGRFDPERLEVQYR